MHVISRKALLAFWEKHPESRMPLLRWYKVMSQNDFKTFNDLQMTFPSTDLVEGFAVFNIAGNNYRLIASVHFNRKKVYVRDVLTHAEYDRGGWKR